MKNRLILSVIILAIVLCIISTLGNCVYATDNFDITYYESNEGDTTLVNPVNKVMGTVLLVVRTVAMGIAIIVITVIAVKYMMSAPGERADLKKSAIQYLIGVLIVFASAEIFKILVNTFQDFK